MHHCSDKFTNHHADVHTTYQEPTCGLQILPLESSSSPAPLLDSTLAAPLLCHHHSCRRWGYGFRLELPVLEFRVGVAEVW
jgi:hypothetical protein